MSRETGHTYNRLRTLHHRLGRFTQRDPIGYADGLNLYQYLASAPTSSLDPLGLEVTQNMSAGPEPGTVGPGGGKGGGWSSYGQKQNMQGGASGGPKGPSETTGGSAGGIGLSTAGANPGAAMKCVCDGGGAGGGGNGAGSSGLTKDLLDALGQVSNDMRQQINGFQPSPFDQYLAEYYMSIRSPEYLMSPWSSVEFVGEVSVLGFGLAEAPVFLYRYWWLGLVDMLRNRDPNIRFMGDEGFIRWGNGRVPQAPGGQAWRIAIGGSEGGVNWPFHIHIHAYMTWKIWEWADWDWEAFWGL